MATTQVRLADLDDKRDLAPNYPVTLDTEFNWRDRADVFRVSDPRVVEALIKLHALFTPHLVLHEAQVLDHSGMRAYFNLLETRSELPDALRYFTNPGADTLGLGPVVLASERYDAKDSRHPFPLIKLLARKLGADDPNRHPWELSSLWNAPGVQRDQARFRIRQAKPAKRLSTAMRHLGPADTYEHYIALASEVWDVRADVTRVPLRQPEYAQRLKHLLVEYKSSFNELSAKTANELVELISSGSLSLGKEVKSGINRSTVHIWLRQRSTDKTLDALATRAHPEAFVLAFPSRRGWNSTHDPERLGFWRGPERAAGPKPKRPLDDTISAAAADLSSEPTPTNASPILLSNLTYKHLITLRNSPEFHASLTRLWREWDEGFNLQYVGSLVQKHIEFMWNFLGFKKRSSTVCIDAPRVKLKWVVNEAFWTAGVSSTALSAAAQTPYAATLNPYAISFGPVCLVVKHLWTWATPTEDWRSMMQVARLIRSRAVQDQQSSNRCN